MESKTNKIVFFGTPSFAVPSLEAILQSGRTVSLVVTQPDRPAGRGKKLKASAVKEFSLRHHLNLIQPKKMRDPAFSERLSAEKADLFVVAAYGRILPKNILDIPALILNVHASLLPRWRGAAPIERAIINGDRATGISIIRLVEELDAGDMLLAKETAIDPNETGFELEARLSAIGSQAILEALDLVDRGRERFKPQDRSQVTFAPPLKVEEGKIDWGEEAEVVHNKIRALQPWPGAHTDLHGERIKIYRTARSAEKISTGGGIGTPTILKNRMFFQCKDQTLEILELQREGRKRQPTAQFLSGYRVPLKQKWED